MGSIDVPGSVYIDEGAIKAICSRGKSLLPIGVLSVSGNFRSGEVIHVKQQSGKTIAQGISNFSSDDVERIKRKSTQSILEIMGKVVHEELIHRNNLVLA